MRLLVLNCGSSSIKYGLLEAVGDEIAKIASGIVERIGEPQGVARLFTSADKGVLTGRFADHHAALQAAFGQLAESGQLGDFSELAGCAHRVVHGGAHFVAPVLIDQDVIATIQRLIPLAPLHNPANLEGIRAIMKMAPALAQIALFDTAFHQTLPPVAYRYALPAALFEKEGIRRYGFHGLSHHYLMEEAAKRLGKPPRSCNLITLHLGNGASATAIYKGKSIDTSMGFTPLEGLVMGTRGGDLDPGILLYLQRHLGKGRDEVDELLNRESGLKGIAGANDMREILRRRAAGDAAAELAFSIFCYRIRKYIGAYVAVLGRVDAIVFSGGIGERSVEVRQAVCEGMGHLGILPDPDRNEEIRGVYGRFEVEDAPLALMMIRTDEELMMARQGIALLRRRPKG